MASSQLDLALYVCRCSSPVLKLLVGLTISSVSGSPLIGWVGDAVRRSFAQGTGRLIFLSSLSFSRSAVNNLSLISPHAYVVILISFPFSHSRELISLRPYWRLV